MILLIRVKGRFDPFLNDGVYKYVGRYLRRGPISEKRIVGYDGDQVTIGYAYPEKHKQRIFILDAKTFIARLLSHVPDKGTHLVRSYGLFHPNYRGKLDAARAGLNWVSRPMSR